MLNYIWFFMIVIGVIYGFITGNIEKVGSGAIESATEAVKLCITMVGIMSMWMGFMEVARTSGLIRKAEKGLDPVVSWLFPNIPKNHPALASITTNIIAKNCHQSLWNKRGVICRPMWQQMKCVLFWL